MKPSRLPRFHAAAEACSEATISSRGDAAGAGPGCAAHAAAASASASTSVRRTKVWRMVAAPVFGR